MADEQKGIEGSLALLKGVQDLANDYQLVMADGKVDLKDLSVIGTLFGQWNELKAAYDGVKEIPAEVKDLDDLEIAQLAAAALGIVKAFRKPAAV